jgi:hypothetical protein
MITGGVRYVNPDGTLTIRGLEEFKKFGAGGGGGGAVTWADVTGKPSTFAPSAHTHVIADVTGLQAALDSKRSALYAPMAPAAGEFIGNGLNATALGTQAQVANRTVIAPFSPCYDVTIDQLGCSISTGVASSNVKCIIYAADASGRPSTVLRETANIDSATTGTKFASITSLVLDADTKYWIGLRSSSTATVRTLGVGSAPAITYTSAATPAIESALILTETFANAAATWTYAASQHSNALVPLILMRVA